MRVALLIAIMLMLSLLILPASALARGKAPTVTLSLSPASMDVVSNNIDTVSVQFNGTATVQMGMFDRNTYTLSLTAQAEGWQCVVSPEMLTFSTSGSMSFECTVQIPPLNNNITATVLVTGRMQGGGFTITGNAESQLVIETVKDNQAQAQQTIRTGGAGIPTAFYIAVPAISIASAAFMVYLRFVKKRRSG